MKLRTSGKGRKARDPQQDRVYEAESIAGAHASRQFADISECADWIQGCLQSGLVDQDWPSFRTFVYKTNDPGEIIIRERRRVGSTIAHATRTDLAFSRDGQKTWIALHELAHMISSRCFNAHGHGWQFCEIYLRLIGWFIGRPEQTALQEQFDRLGVMYSKEQAIPKWLHRRVGGRG